jgi:hypothetical protein
MDYTTRTLKVKDLRELRAAGTAEGDFAFKVAARCIQVDGRAITDAELDDMEATDFERLVAEINRPKS